MVKNSKNGKKSGNNGNFGEFLAVKMEKVCVCLWDGCEMGGASAKWEYLLYETGGINTKMKRLFWRKCDNSEYLSSICPQKVSICGEKCEYYTLPAAFLFLIILDRWWKYKISRLF